jgi:hypothetical protein
VFDDNDGAGDCAVTTTVDDCSPPSLAAAATFRWRRM